jgi:hypothetical protein
MMAVGMDKRSPVWLKMVFSEGLTESKKREMAKGIKWTKGAVLIVKLRDNMFTLSQMLTSPVMRFFKITSDSGEWAATDLKATERLFTLYVGQVVLQQLVERKLKLAAPDANLNSDERLFIKPYLNFKGGFPFKGGRLIDVGPEASSTTRAPIIKENLSVQQDRSVIEKYELTNMWGADDLRERLLGFFETGVDTNQLKLKVFPDL